MKYASISTKNLLALAMAGILAACGPGSDDAAPSAAQERAPEPDIQPQTPPEDGFRIEIGGDDSMQFDVTEFAVEAGQHVTIVFNNVGTMPKLSMGHNLVVLAKDVDKLEFSNAAQRHVRNEYVPPDRMDDVIAATRVLGPGESDTIMFSAPSETGSYDYVCTFPGHTQAGMVGVMVVE